MSFYIGLKNFYQNYKYWLKWIFSVLMICLIFFKIDIDVLKSSLKVISWWYYLITIILFAFMQFINGFRWHFFLENYKFIQLTKYSFISQYYTFILPSSLTADVSKIAIIKKTNNTEEIIASVICDKIVTFFSMSFTLLIAFLFCSSEGLRRLILPTTFFSLVLILSLIIIYFLKIKSILHFFYRKSGIKFFKTISNDKFIKYFESLHYKMMNFRAVFKSFVSGILVQFINVISFLIIDSIVNLGLNVFDYLIISGALQILLLLPISIGGVGFRDVSSVMVLGLADITSNKALTYSLSLYPALIAVVIIGFFFQLRKYHGTE